MIIKREFKIERISSSCDSTQAKMCELYAVNLDDKFRGQDISFTGAYDDLIKNFNIPWSLDILDKTLTCEFVTREDESELYMVTLYKNNEYFLGVELDNPKTKMEENLYRTMTLRYSPSVQPTLSYFGVYVTLNLSEGEYEEISKLPKPLYFKLSVSVKK